MVAEMDMEIRLLTSADIDRFEHLAEDVFDFAVDRSLAARFLAEPTHHICVAMVEGCIVGFASAVHYLHPDKPAQLWINEVGVAASHRGRGIAKAIVTTLLDHARSLGCVEAWVLTDADNLAARALYRSAGGTSESSQLMVTFRL